MKQHLTTHHATSSEKTRFQEQSTPYKLPHETVDPAIMDFVDPIWIERRKAEEKQWNEALEAQKISAEEADMRHSVQQLWRSVLAVELNKELRGLEKLPPKSSLDRGELLARLQWARIRNSECSKHNPHKCQTPKCTLI